MLNLQIVVIAHPFQHRFYFCLLRSWVNPCWIIQIIGWCAKIFYQFLLTVPPNFMCTFESHWSMEIRFVCSLASLATVNSIAASTAEETLSNTAKCLLHRILEVYFFALFLKKFVLKFFKEFIDDLIDNWIGISVFKLQLAHKFWKIIQFFGYIF